MKEWFNSILNLIKTNKLVVIYILVGILMLVLLFVTIFVAVKKKHAYTPSYNDKSDFVHKVLKYDVSVHYQLLTAVIFGLLIASIVLFLTKLVIASIVTLILFVICWFVKIVVNIKVRFCRVEYNNAEIYKFSFLSKTKVMRWEDITKVEAHGFGANRSIKLIAKKGKEISVPLKMTGYYDFTVFAEGKLDGKNFEAVKIAKARR